MQKTYIHSNKALDLFNQEVLLKYQIYNGLFLGLPFKDSNRSGSLLEIFTASCQEGINQGKDSLTICDDFLTKSCFIQEEQGLALLIKFLQFIERQVVLFDALEEVAFSQIANLNLEGSLNYLFNNLDTRPKETQAQLAHILEQFKVRLCLTAHPTQFYPTHILAIIEDLYQAIAKNDLTIVRQLFLQMGLTRFGYREKPTPVEEAKSLIWHLENVFYPAVSKTQLKLNFDNQNIELGFWPGGDRDGNPFVSHQTTLEVAKLLKNSIVKLYLQDLYKLKRLLSFNLTYELIQQIYFDLEKNNYSSPSKLIDDLLTIKQILIDNYQALFSEQVTELITKIQLFGFYFAKIDIRQNSKIHSQVVEEIIKLNLTVDNYLTGSTDDKVAHLKQLNAKHQLTPFNNLSNLAKEVLNTLYAIYQVQQANGNTSIERYIISNCSNSLAIYELMSLIRTTEKYFEVKLHFEIVPLFESITDLEQAPLILTEIFTNPEYLEQHPKERQTIMLGFSDGTKDGGYFMANWSIYQAKYNLSKVAKKHNKTLVFFDGRGGPPARGGGDTYLFYKNLATKGLADEIQLTIQGQTVSASFGSIDNACYNLEQYLSAGIYGKLLCPNSFSFSPTDQEILSCVAKEAQDYYLQLKSDPLFIEYLNQITPLKHLTQMKIGSRPAKRNLSQKLNLDDLRAIPYGAAWMQMKQNILGFYGLGYGLNYIINKDPTNLAYLQELYQKSFFFQGVINNAMQALLQNNFAISAHLANDPKYGKFYLKIKQEALLCEDLILKITNLTTLMEHKPIKQSSILAREKIALPLTIIQQYAMHKLRTLELQDEKYLGYEKLLIKTLAISINASKNSV